MLSLWNETNTYTNHFAFQLLQQVLQKISETTREFSNYDESVEYFSFLPYSALLSRKEKLLMILSLFPLFYYFCDIIITFSWKAVKDVGIENDLPSQPRGQPEIAEQFCHIMKQYKHSPWVQAPEKECNIQHSSGSERATILA